MWLQINQAWQNFAPREQLLLKVTALFLALVLFYALLWQPLAEREKIAQKRFQQAQQEGQWLQQKIPAVQALELNTAGQTEVRSQTQLMRVLQQSLRQLNLFKDIEQLQGLTQGGRVRFKLVNAQRFFRWLAQLEQQGVVAHKLNVTPVEPGLVAAQVDFK